ncbi:guanine nucleotide-binding protein subunit alpha-15 isoform X2 [Rana temporaria]|uniref:guanine nucleotide-binding protein subunit alpha-15 isoform X2 n=1 Tax=Rana temporaria TaxID=8407 RepID=UPI001AAD7686|nr:guanine nucleotide-binding protein subunit alpha-15 isoform X2 [Rana temporaria]
MPWWCLWCFCPPCLSEDDKAALAINREINRVLKFHKSRDRRELKLLLLGTGESGKSTFIKQMRIIHGTGFSVEDRKVYAILVHQNIVTCAQYLVGAMETLQVPYTLQGNMMNGKLIKSLDVYNVKQIEKHHVAAIKKLWNDPGVRKCYEKRREFHLLDSAYYYLTNLERITEDGYLPTNEDIVRVRMPTTGINEYCFSVDNVTLRMVDVGGQKSERKKWIHCFENVNALIYLASLSEYDQQLEEKKDEGLVGMLKLLHSISGITTKISLVKQNHRIYQKRIRKMQSVHFISTRPALRKLKTSKECLKPQEKTYSENILKSLELYDRHCQKS